VSPVYRFISLASSSWFYTIDEADKRAFITRHSDVWTYEGIVWYACTPPAPAALFDPPE